MKYIGKKEEGKDYKERRTAYALVFNNKHEIAVIIEHGEIYNMIGGKIEDGENGIDTLARETKEEIGYDLQNIKHLEILGCYHYLDFLDKYELAIIDFYSANIGEKVCEPIEKDNELVWVRPEDVVDKMYFEYHRYFIKKYLNR